jgi:hypothetical protein
VSGARTPGAVTACARAIAAACLLAAAPSAGAVSLEDFRDPQDGRLDMSRYLLDLKGFLTVPIVVTDPAVGYGGGAALVFFRRNAPPPGEAQAPGRFTPPDITAAGGIATENGSRAAFVGHLGFSTDGNWRYMAAAAKASLNLSYFVDSPIAGGRELGYNLKADFVVAEARRRLFGSNWHAGLRYLRANTESRFDLGLPEGIPARQADLAIGGLAVVGEYDTRDTIFTPSRGTRIQLQAFDFGPAFGGDDSFRLYLADVNTYLQPHRRLVLGVRLDYRASSGDTPFYAVPYIDMRGIPALRYQGDRVAVAEMEARWDLDGRWSLIGFGGGGRAAAKDGTLGSAPTHWAGGAGFRYYLARAMGLHAGLDVARGPEDTTVYLIVGSAWR